MLSQLLSLDKILTDIIVFIGISILKVGKLNNLKQICWYFDSLINFLHI